MGSLETLPPDQRAVLDLVLQRGRSYDDIARLLGIDRAAVRARALAAFDELGPDTGLAIESRALIADYLLGQLPDRVGEQTRERLARSPYERAWARVLASALEPMAAQPLPEIPDGSRSGPAAPAGEAAPTGEAARTGEAEAAGGPEERAAAGARSPASGDRRRRRAPRLSDRPSSRRGGAIMLGVGALVVIALVVVLIVVLSGGSSSKSTSSAAASRTSPAGSSSTTSSTTPQAQVIGQVNLNPPNGGSTAKGVGFVVKSGSVYGIIIQAQHIPPNNHNSYGAWLYNSPTDASFLGFVKSPVGKNGLLRTGGGLPTNAGHFKQLLLTLETGSSTPTSPGTIVLKGPFKGVPATG